MYYDDDTSEEEQIDDLNSRVRSIIETKKKKIHKELSRELSTDKLKWENQLQIQHQRQFISTI